MLNYKPVARYCTEDDGEVWIDLTSYDQAEAVRRAPETAHSFQIFEQPLPPEGASEIEAAIAVYGEALRLSTTYWLGGQVFCLADLKRRPRLYDAARAWQRLGIVKVIRTRNGTWEPFEDLDILITGA